MITGFCGRFISDFSLAYHWVGLNLFGHLAWNSLIRELTFNGELKGIWVVDLLVLIRL